MIKSKGLYSTSHLMAAAYYSRLCGDIQKNNLRYSQQNRYIPELFHCVSATTMLCISSLEAHINECFDGLIRIFPEIPYKTEIQINKLILFTSRLGIIDKYQKLLEFKNLQNLRTDSPPVQDIIILTKLRNELVHFIPEYDDEQNRHKKIGDSLKYKFELSPFFKKNYNKVFPEKIMCHGCTLWAVNSTMAFFDTFYKIVNSPNIFKSERNIYKG